ncbi:MAG TPA: hypothetical protein VJ438_03240 [Candidatus Nanoarchaeia archaeon]|nr:hypothetical protein [Candidatus Nanoarchaeia archaeon]
MSHTIRRKENWVLSNAVEDEIARGSIEGISEFLGFGERDAIQVVAGGSDLWRGSSVTQPWPNQSGGEQMMVLSSSYDDRLTGTGIQKVEIDYLDAIGNEQYETVNMNGTAWVRALGTNIRFVNAIHAIQVGSGTVAQGDISICANGTLAAVYNMISVGGNMSLSCQRMVPFGKTFYLHEWSTTGASLATANGARVRLRATTIHGTRIVNVFLFTDTAMLQNSTYNKIFHIPKKIPQLSVIKASCEVSGAGPYVAASYSGTLEENE